MEALLLLASKAESGSYGAPDMVPASSAMSTAFAGRPGRAGESISARRPGGAGNSSSARRSPAAGRPLCACGTCRAGNRACSLARRAAVHALDFVAITIHRT